MAISPSPQVPDLGFRNRESGHSGITQHTPRASLAHFETRMPGVSRGQLVCSVVVQWFAQCCMRGRRGWRRSLRW